MFGRMAQRALRCSFTSFFFAMNFLFTHHRCELYSDSHHYLLFTCKSSILCVCVPWIVSCCIAFPTSCSRACVEWGWMINVYKSQFSLQWKIPHTLMLPLCWKKTLHSCCCSWSWVSPVCALALKHFRPKSLHRRLFGLTCSSSSWTVKEEEERSAATVHTLTWSVCCHPCAVWLTTSCFPFAVFCRELSGTFFAVLKTGDVFMSLIRVPLTKDTSSHVGTVCWLRVTDRQIPLGVWCYLHVTRAGNEHQVDCGWKFYLLFIFGRIISSEILMRSTYISKKKKSSFGGLK